MTRKLNEQWIENERMYKAVSPNQPVSCQGCSNWKREGFIFCHVGAKVDVGCGYGKTYTIKDLGPVDENGCLADEHTGCHPTIRPFGIGEWVATVRTVAITVLAYGKTQQQAIDAWNHREGTSEKI